MSNLDKKLTRLEQVFDRLALIEEEKETLQAEYQEIISDTRKLRIKKIKKGYDIICMGCRNKYTTTKNPDANLKDDRPQCRECGTRVEAKK